MSDNSSYNCYVLEVIDKSKYDEALSEISRLRAALEKAERERDDFQAGYDGWRDTYNITLAERDEARKWARRFHKQLKWVCKKTNTYIFPVELLNG